MKHEITSLNTKRTLAASLKKAMQNKPFSKITVSEIIRDCGVNRKTFYYHFENIYDLLRWMFEEEAIEVVKHFDLLDDYEDAIRFVMDYVENNDYIINCTLDSIGRDQMKQFFFTDFTNVVVSVIDAAEKRQNLSFDPEFKNYIAQFYTEALSSMLIDWAKNKNSRDKEKTIQYLTSIISNALMSIK
ncbi:MAG: TetR/AcrR family transcriptional regulator C-terminal domain-containing protein [Lachnospiraceae bacterium]